MIIINSLDYYDTEGMSEAAPLELFGSQRRSTVGYLVQFKSQFVSNERIYNLVVNKDQLQRIKQFAYNWLTAFDFVDHQGFSWLVEDGTDDDNHAYNTGAYFKLGQILRERPYQANGFVCSNLWSLPVSFVVNARGFNDNSAASGGSGGGVDMDTEVPTGTINGTNPTFILSQTPVTLLLFVNGLLQQESVDYTLVGATITFLAGAIPQSGDSILAYFSV